VIAFAETLVGSQLGGQYSEPISMALALAVLLARPQGLFGTKSLVRVLGVMLGASSRGGIRG
jgi:branched-subunit amino acid ABC-type transport system permease component